MSKSISWFILLFYLVPFTIVLEYQFILGYIQVLTIFLCFFIGSAFFIKSNKLVPIDINKKYDSGISMMLFMLSLYIVFRFPLILEVIENLLSGTYAEWALQNAIERYRGGDDLGVLHNIGTALFIAYAVSLGMYSSRGRFIFYTILIMMLVVESFSLGRSSILLAGVAMVIEIIIRKNKSLQNFSSLNYMKLILGLVLILFIVFGTSAFFRLGGAEENVFEILQFKLGEYTLASYQAFYIWSEQIPEKLLFGQNTFSSLGKIFFSTEVAQGYYDAVETDFGFTPIYTNIRGFLEDFGILGVCMLFFVFGYIVKYCTYSNIGFFKLFFLRIVLYLILFVIYSPFLFTTALIGFFFPYIFLGLYLLLNTARKQRTFHEFISKTN